MCMSHALCEVGAAMRLSCLGIFTILAAPICKFRSMHIAFLFPTASHLWWRYSVYLSLPRINNLSVCKYRSVSMLRFPVMSTTCNLWCSQCLVSSFFAGWMFKLPSRQQNAAAQLLTLLECYPSSSAVCSECNLLNYKLRRPLGAELHRPTKQVP